MKTLLAVLATTLVAGSAFAAPASDIRISTDPAKIAAIEKHAKELQARDQAAARTLVAPAPVAKASHPPRVKASAAGGKGASKAHRKHKRYAKKVAKG